MEKMGARHRELAKTKTGEALERALFEEGRRLGEEALGGLKAIRARAAAAKFPAEVEPKAREFLGQLDGQIAMLARISRQSWDDIQKRKAEAETRTGRTGTDDAWLRDWSENIRTNKALETCAGFRERKLRPFLLGEMDPGGKATAEERKLMNAAVDAVWGADGFGAFGKRKELVALLDRLANKPFAALVGAFAERKDARKPAVAWLESGKFAGEDLRAVFWTLRNDLSTTDAAFSKLLEKADVDPWIKATWRIGPAHRAAWKARGGGWARDVTSEGWEGYRKSGDACRAAFGEAMALKPYPEPVYCFIPLGPFGDDIFTSATLAQLDFPNLYREYLWYTCFPRWGGSHGKMKAFAERCYATKRHDSMVPFFYAETILRMVADGGAEGGLQAYFTAHPDELDKILEVTLPQMNSPHATEPIRKYAGAYATLAYCLKGDWEKAGETFRSFGHATFPDGIWKYIDNFSNWWMIWDGISGPNRKEMQALQRIFAEGDYRRFLKATDEACAALALSEKERACAATMKVAAKMKSTFLDGEPVRAAFPANKLMWLTYGGGLAAQRRICVLWRNEVPWWLFAGVERAGAWRVPPRMRGRAERFGEGLELRLLPGRGWSLAREAERLPVPQNDIHPRCGQGRVRAVAGCRGARGGAGRVVRLGREEGQADHRLQGGEGDDFGQRREDAAYRDGGTCPRPPAGQERPPALQRHVRAPPVAVGRLPREGGLNFRHPHSSAFYWTGAGKSGILDGLFEQKRILRGKA